MSFKTNITQINTPWAGHHIFAPPKNVSSTTENIVCAHTALNSTDISGFYFVNSTTGSRISKFLVKGMGYSPTPIGMEPTDYYTTQYRYLYLNDIPLIAAMGVNVIRLWEWNFQSNHDEFFDLLEKYNIQVLIPFLFTKQNYPDLGDEQDVRNLLLDFSTLVETTINYPVVLGYLIGNELNIEYEGFMQDVFPIVNQLSVIVKEKDLEIGRPCPHLVMVPLSNSNFGELVSQYNKFVNFTNWALQVYNPNLTQTFADYLIRTNDRPLPLLLTEFGADAYNYNVTNITDSYLDPYAEKYPFFSQNGTIRQSNTILNMWNSIEEFSKYSSISGGVVMEFIDEWWKGNEADMIDIACPNTNLNEHSACGQQSDSTFIHEEYLGVFSQNPDSIKEGTYCIDPRDIYFNLSAIWNTNGSVPSVDFVNQYNCRYYVGIFDAPFIYIEILVLIIFFLIVIILSAILKAIPCLGKERKVLNERTPLIPSSLKQLEDQVEDTIKNEVSAAFKRVLFNDINIQNEFEIHEDPDSIVPEKYQPMRDRISRQILDYMDQNFGKADAVKFCYLRTLENYFLWKGKGVNTKPKESYFQLLDKIVLWSIIYSESGTIAHCPNMLCAVYHYVSENKKLNRVELSTCLENIFSHYCTQIDLHQFSFDDVNYHGLERRPSNFIRIIGKIFRFTPFIRFADSAAPIDETKITSHAARDFIKAKKMRSCFNFRRNWITALFTLAFNLTWLLRIDLWMIYSSWYLQPTTITDSFSDVVVQLSLSDALLMLISSVAQFFIWRSHYELRHFIVLLWRSAMMAFAIYCVYYAPAVSPDYLYISIIIWILAEVYFNIFRLIVTKTEGNISSNFSIKDSFSKFYKWILCMLCPITSLVLAELLFYYVLIPSFDGVDQNLCNCPLEGFINSPQQTYICSIPARIACYGGFILVWISSIIVSIIFLYASYIGLMLFIGIVEAKRLSVGTFVTWDDLTSNKWLELEYHGQKFCEEFDRLWDKFIDSLITDWVISPDEGALLRIKDFDRPPAAFEARRRILSFANSWYAIITCGVISEIPNFINHSKLVQHMPSFSTLIPVYNETIIYDSNFLRSHSQDQPVSNFEYLVNTYPYEWSNFCTELFGYASKYRKPIHKIITNCFQSNDYTEMWDVHTNFQPADKESKEERIKKWEWRIRVWASCHGQTLARTLRGLANVRYGLSLLNRNTALVKRKFQVVVSYQTFARLSPVIKDELRDLQSSLGFDLVYPSNEREGSFNSCYERDTSIRISGASEMLNLITERAPPTIITVPRPSGFPIGEGKAENQMQALPFAHGSIFQALDMNQYFSLENSFFIPLALYSHFAKRGNEITPKYRILGFPEYTYSRPLGAVGEYMGLAEFAFVTIIQRVLSAIQVRLHYGHPDFFDGYWAYYRGGPSKSTKVVNVNEDVFAGYEVTQRGEKIGYVEYFQGQKGRESGFNAATVFLTKLAQGAAQQVLSKDVYILNETLPVLERFSFFFGSLGFYVITYLMVFSIFCYLFSLTFFAIAGVTYHQLGLVGSAIAVPWIVQVGFIQMFPVMIELIIEDGFWSGLVHFLIHLPFMLLFFLFQIKTTAYHFQYGLTMGRGGYKSTGRGFELARSSIKQILQRYSKSHFISALMLLFGMILYFLVTQEEFITAIIRMWSIELIIFSWLLAPVVFNPFPNSLALSKDLAEAFKWIQTPFPVKFHISEFSKKIWPIPPNQETQHDKNMKVLLEEHAETSWEFSFWTQLIEESLITKSSQKSSYLGMFSFLIDMSLTFGQWVLFILLPVYGMIALALIKLWSISTLPIIILCIGFLFLYLMSQEILMGRSRGAISGVLIVTLIFLITFWIFTIRTISYLDLLLSLFLDLVVIYLIDAVFRGIAYYIVCQYTRTNNTKKKNEYEEMNFREKTVFGTIYIRDVIRFVCQAPKAFPILLTIILYIGHLLTSWFSSSLMSILYNTRLTHRWRNFELYHEEVGSGLEVRINASTFPALRSKKAQSDIISSFLGIVLYQNDIDSLRGIEWLTDNIISGVMYRQRLSKRPTRKWFFVNCEIAKNQIQTKNCFIFTNLTYDYLIIPICEPKRNSSNTFWSVMICDMRNGLYSHFDSSENSINQHVAVQVANQMNLQCVEVDSEWKKEINYNYNCGVRIIQIVKLFTGYILTEMQDFRLLMTNLSQALISRSADEDRNQIENSLVTHIAQEIEDKKEYEELRKNVADEQVEELKLEQLQSLEFDKKKIQSIAKEQGLSIIYKLEEDVIMTRNHLLLLSLDKKSVRKQMQSKIEELQQKFESGKKRIRSETEMDILIILNQEIEVYTEMVYTDN